MDGLNFRKTDPDEIDLMTKARVEYCMREYSNIEKSCYEEFYGAVRKWTIENVSKGNYLGYFGYLNDEIVCFAGLLLNELPPIVMQKNRKQGYILSFFTYPEYRKKGIGTELMRYITNDANKMGLAKLVLIATDEGIPLYRKSGFSEPSMLYMEKKL